MDKPRSSRRQITGRLGEQAAVDYVQHHGYELIVRNWRCTLGELDIVAKDGETLVFIEVRSRSTTGSYGTAQESVDARKQATVRKVARMYLHQLHLFDSRVRFDVITVQLLPDGTIMDLRHVMNAF